MAATAARRINADEAYTSRRHAVVFRWQLHFMHLARLRKSHALPSATHSVRESQDVYSRNTSPSFV